MSNWFGLDENNETWYGQATTYFWKNDMDLDFGMEIGFIEEQCDVWTEIRAGLDENYRPFSSD